MIYCVQIHNIEQINVGIVVFHQSSLCLFDNNIDDEDEACDLATEFPHSSLRFDES